MPHHFSQKYGTSTTALEVIEQMNTLRYRTFMASGRAKLIAASI
jgi:hypothetical protein